MPQIQNSRPLISGEEAHARVPRLSLCLHGTVLAWNRSAVERSYGTEESNLVTVWLAWFAGRKGCRQMLPWDVASQLSL